MKAVKRHLAFRYSADIVKFYDSLELLSSYIISVKIIIIIITIISIKTARVWGREKCHIFSVFLKNRPKKKTIKKKKIKIKSRIRECLFFIRQYALLYPDIRSAAATP